MTEVTDQIRSDFSRSLEFLRVIYPTGPWKLTAISVDKKAIDSRTFDPGEEADILSWLKLYERRNLYYSVNPPVDEARDSKKCEKAQVLRVHYLHVDVDPRAGEPVEEEQERIRRQFEEYRIPVTRLVFSGGGYNGLWKLDEPIPIAEGAKDKDEAVARAVDVERRNWQFELDFGTPDHCRDVSRILRLPGTINRPNADKVARGRVPALAKLVISRDEEVHPLTAFMATPHVSSNASIGTSRVSENVQRVESLDHLKVPEKLKVLIAQGFDPEEPTRWSSRSDALFFVCCELVREGISDELILGVITDSRYLISASVLDKGASATRYAIRQVQRARDKAENPLLAAMNEQFAVILSYGAKTAIMVEDGEINPDTGRPEPVIQSFRDFELRIKNYPKMIGETATGKPKAISAFEYWTSHKRRRQFRGIVFEPGIEVPEHVNTWGGFSVAAVPGERHLRFLEHMRENICAGNEENFRYLERWMARCVQQPRSASMVAPVLLGERGTGKSIFCDFFGQIFEPHRHTVSDVNALTGKFNAHLSQCLLVVAEEAFDLRDKRHESVLKEFITGKKISVERKNFDRVQMKNHACLIMTSNNERVVPAGDHERRFFVVRVASHRRQDSAYFRAILEDQRSGGVANLLHHLLAVDLRDFDVTAVPQTRELREQQEHNLALELEWLLHKLETGRWFDDRSHNWTKVLKRDLYADYLLYMESAKARNVRGTRAFGRFIAREIPEVEDKSVYVRPGTQDRQIAHIFPGLERCRELFALARGWKNYRWPEVGDQVANEEAPIAASARPFE